MPRLIVTEAAALGLEQCRLFLESKNPLAMAKAAEVIAHHLNLLTQEPEMGRTVHAKSGIRELIIPFGQTGYVALYLFDEPKQAVYVLAFRHQKEVGY